MAFDFPFVREAVTQLFKKSSCEEYPFKPKEAFANYRGRIAFDGSKCIKCGLCEKVCAGGAISTRLVSEDDEKEVWERTFDLTSCTFCHYCADFCAKNAIELTGDFHLTGTKHEDLLVKGEFIKAKKKPKAAAKAE